MVKFNKKTKVGLIFIVLIALSVIFVGGQQFAIYTEPVGYLVPKFGSAQCLPAGDVSIEKPVPVDRTYWTCGIRSESQTNIPQDVDKCKVEYKYKSGLTITAFYKGFDAKKCTIGQGDSTCQKYDLPKLNNYNTIDEININQEIRTQGFTGTLTQDYKSGDATIRMTAQQWGIQIINVDGFRQQIMGCNAESLQRDFLLQKEITKISGNKLERNQVLNWIGGATPLYDVADIIKGDIVGYNGEIYVVAPQQYYKVSQDKTAAGLRIVDTSQIFTSAKIQCRPSQNTLCNPDASLKKTITDPTGATCTATRGISPGWFGVASDSTKIGQQACIDGKIQLINIKSIPQCKSGEVLNTNYDCVKGGAREPTGETCKSGEIKLSSTSCMPSWIIFAIILGIVLIMVAITVIVVLSRGGRGKYGK